MKTIFKSVLPSILIAALLGGCAESPDKYMKRSLFVTHVVNHAFSYDTWVDSPDIEVLNYEYSTDKPQAWQLSDGHIGQRRNIYGPYKRGDFLYVKWQIKATGEIYEDTVDLRKRLPKDINDKRIHFIVNNKQLYVYLISKEKHNHVVCDGPVKMYCHLKTIQIYPDQK